jgi:RNA-binding protein
MIFELTSSQRKRLRGLAHDLRPLVLIGKEGLTEGALSQIDRELGEHELIKVKFIAGKSEKRELALEIEGRLACALAGLVGHVAIYYRPHADPKKRRVDLDGVVPD